MIEFIVQTLQKQKNSNAVFFISKNKKENSDHSAFMLICIINTQKTYVRSEYWDAVAIMEYADRASFCRMVSNIFLSISFSKLPFLFFL